MKTLGILVSAADRTTAIASSNDWEDDPPKISQKNAVDGDSGVLFSDTAAST